MKNLLLFICCILILPSCISSKKTTIPNIDKTTSKNFFNLNLSIDSAKTIVLNQDEIINFKLEEVSSEIDSNSTIASSGTIRVFDMKNIKRYYSYPQIFVKDSFLYSLPDTIHELSMKITINEEFLKKTFSRFENIQYKEFNIKQGESFQFNNYTIALKSLNKTPKYRAKEGDIAVGAELNITQKDNPIFMAKAELIFFIREMYPYSLSENFDKMELSIKFTKIDPVNEIFTFEVASYKKVNNYPIEIRKIK